MGGIFVWVIMIQGGKRRRGVNCSGVPSGGRKPKQGGDGMIQSAYLVQACRERGVME